MIVNAKNLETLIQEAGEYKCRVNFSCLQEESIHKCYQMGEDVIVFECTSGNIYCLYHFQDCCESVYISDICGDLTDLSGKIVRAEETTSELEDYGMWTFYKIDTVNGGVTIRFNGESEYYSVNVDCLKLDCKKLIMEKKINDF